MSVNPAEQYHKNLKGFSGIKQTGKVAAAQIHGTAGKLTPGSHSSRTAADNASFDRSPYHDMLQKSMVAGKLV